ncbi:MAG: helix-hairpin-helix domain-containing protein [Bacteroidales bacterium]|nr:helix-hairpin-helix domain-containing protein [Bacteroidales bacterium]
MKLRERLSKREASGALTLICVIVFIQTLIFLFNNDNKEPSPPPREVMATMKTEPEIVVSKERKTIIESQSSGVKRKNSSNQKEYNKITTNTKEESPQLFLFDPNIATLEELIKLGLTNGQATVVLKYREKGGVFRKREDLKKIYVLPEGFYERVKEFIEIEEINEAPTVKREREAVKEAVKIDLNSADSLLLLSLPGVGPYYAGKIVEFRRKTGGFAYPSQIMDIKGIDREKFSVIQRYIYADTSKIQKKNLEKISFEELSANPYIGSYVARSIIRFRESIHPDIPDLASLLINNIIKPEILKILNYYFH